MTILHGIHRPASILIALACLNAPVRADLLSPFLWIALPKLETHLFNECLEVVAGDDADLIKKVRPACKSLSKPIASCLLNQTAESGRGMGVISELIGSEFGEDSEYIVKRCIATFFDLPADTFNNLPLRDVINKLKS